MKKPISVEDKVVILTGGAGLLGRRYAQVLAESGARVAIADLRLTDCERVVDDLKHCGPGELLPLEVDVCSPESIHSMVNQVLLKWGRIDGLVNNAALDPKFDVDSAAGHRQRFEDYPLVAWEQSLRVNLTGTFLCCQSVGRVMLNQCYGSIVNVASTYGLVSPNPSLYLAPGETEPSRIKPPDYPVTKAAVVQLTRYLAAHWGNHNVRVNTLVPGGVQSKQDEGFIQRYSSMVPMGRMALPEEMTGAVIFLLSDASSYMTGAELVVDGGWTCW